MTDREKLELRIRELLTADIDAITFRNQLFHQGIGLFPHLGRILEDRRDVVQTDIFRTALLRLRELERQEMEAARRHHCDRHGTGSRSVQPPSLRFK
jgi:hypothetical protein